MATMSLFHFHSRHSVRRFGTPLSSPPRSLLTRASLPFPPEKAQFHKELEAAVNVVERACRLCVDVKKSLLSSQGRILEKNDQTPVTIADFGVQALISLELSRLFPSIPLVAEEDSAFLRSSTADSEKDGSNSLADLVLSAVVDKASDGSKSLTLDSVLKAIDRGGKNAVSFDSKPATYWVLDPIDGTRGFLKGNEALYVWSRRSQQHNWWKSNLSTGGRLVSPHRSRLHADTLEALMCSQNWLMKDIEGECSKREDACGTINEDFESEEELE